VLCSLFEKKNAHALKNIVSSIIYNKPMLLLVLKKDLRFFIIFNKMSQRLWCNKKYDSIDWDLSSHDLIVIKCHNVYLHKSIVIRSFWTSIEIILQYSCLFFFYFSLVRSKRIVFVSFSRWLAFMFLGWYMMMHLFYNRKHC
jgi:hypothetical protein